MAISWLSADLAAWVPVSFFLFGPWAQVIRNYQARASKGLSHRSVFLVVAGLSCTVLYNFFFNLPLAYRIMHPLILSTWLILAWQEYHYSANQALQKNMRRSYTALAVFFLTMLVWGQSDPLKIGGFLGWTLAGLLAVFQVPQVLKNYNRKSVEGLSFTYLTILSFGSMAELAIAYWRLLPVQNVLNAVRGICFYFILVYQFSLYARAKKKK